jgi:hypothetical protein
MTDPIVYEFEGKRGAKYFCVDLSDGRLMSVLQNPTDTRVWLGVKGEPSSFKNQPGGIGTIKKKLDDWHHRMALNPMQAELYWSLTALKNRREGRTG